MLERRSLPPHPCLLEACFLEAAFWPLVRSTAATLEIPLPLAWWFPFPTHLPNHKDQSEVQREISAPCSSLHQLPAYHISNGNPLTPLIVCPTTPQPAHYCMGEGGSGWLRDNTSMHYPQCADLPCTLLWRGLTSARVGWEEERWLHPRSLSW